MSIIISVAAFVSGYYIADPVCAIIMETKSVFIIRVLGFGAGIAAIILLGCIKNRVSITKIKGKIGEIVDSGMIVSILPVTALGGGICYFAITNSPPSSITDCLIVVSGILGFLAEGWFIGYIVLVPLIIKDLFFKQRVSS